MKHTRELPAQAERVQTGPLKFGDDWAGIFIRGSAALQYAQALEWLSKQVPDPIQRETVAELRHLLLECDERF